MKLLLPLTTLVAVAACAPRVQQICTDEYVDKLNPSVQVCTDVAVEYSRPERTPWVDDKDRPTPPKPPEEPKPPVEPPEEPKPPVEPPEEPKDDNSDANGKGGNHHDRGDKETDPQETAEENKS